jgi:hypothetical protein
MFKSDNPIDQLVDLGGLFSLNMIRQQLYAFIDIQMDKNHWKFKNSDNFMMIEISQDQIDTAYYCSLVTNIFYFVACASFVISLPYRCDDMENKYSIYTKPEGVGFAILHYIGAIAIPTMFVLFLIPFALVWLVQKVLGIK